MTKKDYELIAQCINASIKVTQFQDELAGVDTVRRMLRDALKEKNPKFDTRAFFKACYKD